MEIEFYQWQCGVCWRNVARRSVSTKGGHGGRTVHPDCRKSARLAGDHLRSRRRDLVDSARDCDLAPSTALRLLRTLETTGFVSKDESGIYRPGSRIIQLGAQALTDESLIDLSGAAMEELAPRPVSPSTSASRGTASALYISIVEGTHSVRHASWVGRTVRWTRRRRDTRCAAGPR